MNRNLRRVLNLINPGDIISGALHPPVSSNAILTQENVNFLRRGLYDKIDEETEEIPRFTGDWLENGYWRINFADRWTLIWFLELVQSWTFEGQPFEFNLLGEIPTFKYSSFIPGTVLENFKILQQIFKLNDLDTSKWRIVEKREVNGGFEIDFRVDLLNACKLDLKNYKLNFGMHQINLSLVEEVEEEAEN